MTDAFHRQVWRIGICLFALVAGGHCRAAQPADEIRVLLVGVGKFAPGTSGVDPLDGPVNDVAAVESVLRQRLAPTSTLQFRKLMDQSATRANILSEIESFLGASRPGSTAILYFSGHGSRVYGVVPHKPDRYDSTIIPYDARIEGQPSRDIRDVDLAKALAPLDRKGVHVVALLDSCFSGGATRTWARLRYAAPTEDAKAGEGAANVTSTAAPPVPGSDAAPSESTSLLRSGRKLQVVFSASGPDAEAYESAGADGVFMGDFTRAFVASMRTGPRVMTYHELKFGIRSGLRGFPRGQTPYTQGDLDRLAFEAGGTDRGRLVIEASRVAPGRYSIDAGKLVGITVGSEYAAYDSASKAAFSKAAPLAKGNIRSLTLGTAELAFSVTQLPKTLFVTETVHSFTGEPLRVWLDDSFDALRQRFADRSAKVTGVTLTDRAAAEIALIMGNGAAYAETLSGSRARIGLVNDSLEENLEAYLRAASRAKSLVNLRHDDVSVDANFRIMIADPKGGVLLEPERQRGAYVLHSGDKIYACFQNGRSSAKLHYYLLSLSPENELHVLYPPSIDGADAPLAPGAAHPSDDFDVSRSGTDLLKLIVTDAAIASYVLDRLENDGQTARSRPQQLSALDQFLSEASKGARITPRALVQTWATREALIEVRADVRTQVLKLAPPCR